MEERFLKPCERKLGRDCGVGQLPRLRFTARTAERLRSPFGIVPSENAEGCAAGSGLLRHRADPGIGRKISEFIEKHRVLSVAMTDGVFGCPHQEGNDYEGEGCPICEFWHGRRFTGRGTINFCEIEIGNGVTGRPFPSRMSVCELGSSRCPMARSVYLSMNRHTQR